MVMKMIPDHRNAKILSSKDAFDFFPVEEISVASVRKRTFLNAYMCVLQCLL